MSRLFKPDSMDLNCTGHRYKGLKVILSPDAIVTVTHRRTWRERLFSRLRGRYRPMVASYEEEGPGVILLRDLGVAVIHEEAWARILDFAYDDAVSPWPKPCGGVVATRDAP